jgi:bacterioferritin
MMRSTEPGVLDYLNKALLHELTAVNQYWLHHRLLDNWGYKSLAKQWRKESIEEMEHADKLHLSSVRSWDQS